MTIDEAFRWCYDSPSLGIIRDSAYAIPIIQSVHLVGLTMVLAVTVTLNLRLVGIGLRQLPLPVIASQLWRWAVWGMVLAISSGILVFLPDPVRYVHSGPFQLKMLLLCSAAAYHFTVFKRVTRQEAPSPTVRNIGAAMLSLTLWFSVGWCGRAIAFFK
jgi:hypothetical protein